MGRVRSRTYAWGGNETHARVGAAANYKALYFTYATRARVG
ncbi:hypothetical protein CCACVL1_00235 [Corchorus capsularis]|uniref:Uncharacterized protein n=1 Tax=Corchorus capsularis TaxID=210143 RepID=A0A1R3KXQ1_COCAP|nr:hypothetical protein CCACVL1_00235 [Corchorus capsularis]